MYTYFSWWYGAELRAVWQAIGVMTTKVYSFFSINLLLATLFDPWKRDVAYAENISLNEQLRLMVENLTSRFIGFVIRLFTILVGITATIIFVILMIGLFCIWIFLPLVILFLIFNGTRIMLNG